MTVTKNTKYDVVGTDAPQGVLSETYGVQSMTANGIARSGPCEFAGIALRAFVGGPQTVTVYDALSATGTPIATFTVNALGMYWWGGNWTTPGAGEGPRRQCQTGIYVSFSGGTSRTIDVVAD